MRRRCERYLKIVGYHNDMKLPMIAPVTDWKRCTTVRVCKHACQVLLYTSGFADFRLVAPSLVCIPPHHLGSGAWKVVYLDLAARQRKPPAPPPPSKEFPPLDSSRRGNAHYKFQRIQVTSMSATSAPRNLPWNSASTSSGEEMGGVLDLPYKKALHGSGKPEGGRRRGPGGKGGRGPRGGAAPLKSAAWRKKSSAPRIRKSGKAGEGSDARRGTNGREENAAPDLPRRPPPAVAVDVKAPPSPFPSSARPDSRRSSMCVGNLAMRGSHCRLLL